MVMEDKHDVIGRDKYAVLENVPLKSYYFLYYTMFDYGGVSYTMYTEMPSGGITFSDTYGMVETSPSETQTTLMFTITEYGGYLQNKVSVNGVDYEFTTYEGEYDTAPTLVLDGTPEITSVVIYFNPNISNYESISQEITVKGTLYRAITL